MKNFQKLTQLLDLRGLLPTKNSYTRRNTALKDCKRAWHHSLTKKDLDGSNAQGFANYHVHHLGWHGIGYHFVVEPQNVVDTPKGKRARIVYCNDVSLRTFHVGNSNDFAIGICVAGDYRTDELDYPTIASVSELQDALVKDGIGNGDLSHHEFAGYGWKQCCVFDYKETFSFLDNQKPLEATPDEYVVQQGDTLWGIANGDDRFTVEDLMTWNNIKDPSGLQIGQRLVLKVPSVKEAKPTPPVRKVLWTGKVKVSALNVRKGSGIDFPVVTQLKRDDNVTVYQELKNGWLDIGNGQFVSNVNQAYIERVPERYKDAGRRVEAIAATVNFYDTPRWERPSGQFTRGQGWIIVDQVTTSGSPQLKVKNSRGNIFYITARTDLVRIV